MRVKLLKQLSEELPVDSVGSAMYVESGKLPKRGLIRVQWDNGMNIPMYRNEIKPVESVDGSSA